MGKRIPIEIKKIVDEDKQDELKTDYAIIINDKSSSWDKIFTTSLDRIVELRDNLNIFLESISIKEKLGLTSQQNKTLEDHYSNDNLCNNCSYRNSKKCKACLFILDSPLERALYIELLKLGIHFQFQYPINREGNYVYFRKEKIDFTDIKEKQILTISDFYISSKKGNICIYTDGHTYHERTEDQAKHDRRIDRILQENNYVVLRYTGKEIRTEIDRVVQEIKQWLD